MSHNSGHVIFPPPPKRTTEDAGGVTGLSVDVQFPDQELNKFYKKLNRAADKFYEIMDEPDEN